MLRVPVPDFIRRNLLPGERIIWLGKSRMSRVVLYDAPTLAAAVAFSIWLFPRREHIVDIGLAISIAHTLLVQLGSHYVLTDSRAIIINRILPPHCLYLNLIDAFGAPAPIKLGWIDGIRFDGILPRQQTVRNRFCGRPSNESVLPRARR